MYFQRIYTPGLSINTYLLGDEMTKQCLVIDPTRRIVPLIMQAQNDGMEITDILETHVHADFVSGARELKHQLNDKPRIHASGMGGKDWIPSYADVVVQHGAKIKLGDLRLEAIHTPGHTPEHVMWVCYDESRSIKIPWFAFTGDCLFVGSIGRPDLLGRDKMKTLVPQLYHTLFEEITVFPDFLEILPAHGEGSLCGKSLKARTSSTLGYERLFNPYLKKNSKEQWIKKMENDVNPAPPYFQEIKKCNVEGPPLLSQLKTEVWINDGQSPRFDDLFLLDIRHPETFAAGHFNNAINIPISSSFCHWAGWMLPYDKPLGIILEKTQIYSEVVEELRTMGFNQDIWIIQLEESLQEFPCPVSSFPIMEVEELTRQDSSGQPIYILDVRSPEEWRSGHIPMAHHVELDHLNEALPSLPADQSIALVCRSGMRASLAASLLQKNGFSSVMNLRGGMQSWKQAGLPLEVGEK